MKTQTTKYTRQNGSIDISAAMDTAERLRRATMHKKVTQSTTASKSTLARIAAWLAPNWMAHAKKEF